MELHTLMENKLAIFILQISHLGFLIYKSFVEFLQVFDEGADKRKSCAIVPTSPTSARYE